MKDTFKNLIGAMSLFALVAGCGGMEEADVAESTESASSALAAGGLVYDTTTQCNAGGFMHCCPDGKVLVGVFAGSPEYFKCKNFGRPFTGPAAPDSSTTATIPLQGATNNYTSMHVCPPNTVLVGIHRYSNRFACRPYQPAPGSTPFINLDLNTQDSENPPGVPKMHTCPTNLQMTGFHEGKNQFTCSSDVIYQ